MHRHQKGQGLLEFALMLPVFLLLLLGIVEAARIMWAYLTVQNAARDAARYAVTGQPYILPEDIETKGGSGGLCQNSGGESGATEPWLCEPVDRVEAIKSIAINEGRALSVQAECTTPGQYLLCNDIPGAFAVRVTGQLISPTVSLTSPISMFDHPGTQGLFVRVETYYNIKMWDPVYDLLMGGNTLQLRGDVQLQNEGLEASLGGEPPEAIDTSNIITGTIPSGTGPNGEEIWSVSGYSIKQNEELIVHLDNHFQPAGPYDIYLSDGTVTGQICTSVATNPQNMTDPDPSCKVDFFTFPPGLYDLYSTFTGNTSRLAVAPQQVEVKAPNSPLLDITGGEVWAANSNISINMIAHQAADQPFNMYFQYGSADQEVIASNLNFDAGAVPWRVKDVNNLCPQGGNRCTIQTRTLSGTLYAETDIYVNDPEIVLAGSNRTFYPGETMFIFLRGHTPNTVYQLQIAGITNTLTLDLGASPQTDGFGITTDSIDWTVPDGWPEGDYRITSHPVGEAMTSGNEIGALEPVSVEIPKDALGNPVPYLTIDGGYVWPIDSYINIKANRHLPLTTHYLEFGTWRVPTSGSNDTFVTGDTGSAIIGYRIPINAVTDGVAKTYDVSSFVAATNGLSATRKVTVYPVPVIRVLEGDRVMPGSTITIEILNHSPDTPYQIIYADKVLLSLLTDVNGYARISYDLNNLPAAPGPDLTDPANYGVFFDMVSKQMLSPGQIVATTQMALQPADLEITNIQLPSTDIEINTSIPVTVTITNLNPVTITRYFDIDYYLDPFPLLPDEMQVGSVLPGDVKLWHTHLGPNSQLITRTELFVGEYGEHSVWAYADTSDFVSPETDEDNNYDDVSFQISCNARLTDPFNSLANWSGQAYGASDNRTPSASGVLQINTDGLSSFKTSDDNSDAGLYYLYWNNVVTTTLGLDVVVKVLDVPTNAEWAKAGLQLRDSLAANSDKIEFDLARGESSRSSEHRVQVAYRSNGSSATNVVNNYDYVSLSTGPVWLRIVREPNSNVFKFYYLQQNAQPTSTDWPANPYAAINNGSFMSQNLYIGLFHSTYRDGTRRTSQFDDFSMVDNYGCAPAQGQPEPEMPPGLRLCYQPMSSPGFEGDNWLSFWKTEPNVARASSPKLSGFFSMSAPSFDSTFHNPWFYQKIKMPSWIISTTTTIDLSAYRYVDQLGTADSQDTFKVALITQPPPPFSQITSTLQTTFVATATTPIATGADANKVWGRRFVELQAAPGINLEDYAGQDVYLMFYNNTNAKAKAATGFCPPANSACGTSKFYFDDMDLTICTEQPLPTNITTQIAGTTTLFFSTGTQRVAGVKVWAYAENGDLYTTFTIQNGVFNFYNLPATATGEEYFIYAEYYIVDELDPTQVETLIGQTSVILKTSNTGSNPVVTALKLR